MEDERIGTIIADRYRLDRVLGHGGMGVVYAGEHKWTQRKLAVKLLQPQVAQSRIAVKRFMQEARAAAGLRHPNVVDVLDLGLDEAGDAYIVLELLEGESLEARIRREGRLSPKDTLDILLPILDALALAHEHGIVHRDLKPANIFLARDARGRLTPKLLDFGVAKLLERPDANISSPMTRPGAMLGTVHYMAPEFVLHEDAVSPQCDVWSMGVVLYRCLAGVLPFDAPANTTLLVMIASMDHEPLCELAPHLPAPVCATIEGALKRELPERTGSIAELVTGLFAAVDAAGIDLEPATRVVANASTLPPEAVEVGRGETPHTNPSDDTIAD